MTYIAKNDPELVVHAPKSQNSTYSLSENTSFFDQISSRGALVAGVATSILIAGTIGFIILLMLFLRNVPS